jgi:uncharacterized protein YjiS (DUF1127 family)
VIRRGQSIKAYADVERRAARRHLHGLLDTLCADFGLDPEEAYRRPAREAERERLLAPIRRAAATVTQMRKAMGIPDSPPLPTAMPKAPSPRRIHINLPSTVKPGDTIELTIPSD